MTDRNGIERATASIRTRHERAAVIAAALAPDDTAEMSTRVAGETIETTIERESVGGLSATVDDYVLNLRVATRIANDLSKGTANDTNNDRDENSQL